LYYLFEVVTDISMPGLKKDENQDPIFVTGSGPAI
jgi:hypothetical protein